MAMSQPTYENEKAAFEGLLWAVDSIACFFDFSDKLEKLIPDLVSLIMRLICLALVGCGAACDVTTCFCGS